MGTGRLKSDSNDPTDPNYAKTECTSSGCTQTATTWWQKKPVCPEHDGENNPNPRW